MVVGIDEVGRGAWAGPLVVGAVIMGGQKIKGLKDSKKLSSRQRNYLDKEIRELALDYSLGWVSANEIDTIGLSLALSLATQRALEGLKVEYDEIIIDGKVNFLIGTKWSSLVTNITRADDLIPSVSAASIIAKVARDKYMVECLGSKSHYNFRNNVGYGTKDHQLALERFGPNELHRFSFKPIQKISSVNTSLVGRKSEEFVANFLVDNGYKIIARNWRHRLCEIDIIAQKNGALFFIEVKHRTNNFLSNGVHSVTDRKIRQMQLAVEVYKNINKTTEDSLRLMVVSTTGQPIKIDEIYEV